MNPHSYIPLAMPLDIIQCHDIVQTLIPKSDRAPTITPFFINTLQIQEPESHKTDYPIHNNIIVCMRVWVN